MIPRWASGWWTCIRTSKALCVTDCYWCGAQTSTGDTWKRGRTLGSSQPALAANSAWRKNQMKSPHFSSLTAALQEHFKGNSTDISQTRSCCWNSVGFTKCIKALVESSWARWGFTCTGWTLNFKIWKLKVIWELSVGSVHHKTECKKHGGSNNHCFQTAAIMNKVNSKKYVAKSGHV